MAQVMTLFNLNLLFIFSFFLLFSSIEARGIKYCDKKGDYPVKVQEVEISPDPVVSGNPATFNISASTVQALSGGKVVIDVSYFGVHVHKETHDLCEETSCPISSGNFVLSHTQSLPTITPPGSYTLKMTMTDKNKQKLTCITFNFKIGIGSLVSDH
ncbi:hypothetical protein Q3G72_003417 [Acer saccharum]|nr:hypothetical protein Q3G72_003417 [Acer saccharum]